MFSRLASRKTAVETRLAFLSHDSKAVSGDDVSALLSRLQHGYKLCDWRMAYGDAWLKGQHGANG